MSKPNYPTPDCEVHFYLSRHEVITSFGASEEIINEIINQGIINVHSIGDEESRFDNEACRRIRLVLQLHRDLGVNVAGAALALELMNEIDQLHTLLKQLGE